MSAKQRILPQFVPEPNLHPGWSFAGHYRVGEEVQGWMPQAQWPEALPVALEVEQAGRRRLELAIAVEAQARLPCQRCGELLDWSAQIAHTLLLVEQEDPELPQPQWLVEEGRVPLQGLVESELSLALPDFPRHERCALQDEAATE